MKVLILTYYWPPAGGSGVQRWLKFVKYMQEFDIIPVVYTADNPSYAILDSGLENEIPESIQVLKSPIWEPYTLLSFFTRKKEIKTSAGFLQSKKSLFSKFSSHIRANYFIPDARMFWIKPSVKFLETYLNENPIDLIISSGPPHSLHKIALELKKKTGIKWISDFRDPWTDIDYFHQLPLSLSAKKKHFTMEKEVLTNADAVLVVGKTMCQKYLGFNNNTYVITNGYDIALNEQEVKLDTDFTITHIGMMNEDRNPHSLWKSLSVLSKEIKGFSDHLKIQLIGEVDSSVLESIELSGLKDNVALISYLPHKEVFQYQRKSQILLLAINRVPSAKGIITGKIFEYLVAKRPILAIGPIDGDLAEILKETNSGSINAFDDIVGLSRSLKKSYQDYRGETLQIDSKDIAKYHRKELTRQLAELIKKTVKS